ncbi:MAG TPA: OmpA family protein [Candidatus Binataceae bacterium]
MNDTEDESPAHESSERWLVSYADFITLLFALFVLLYALSNNQSQQLNQTWRAMASAVGARPMPGGTRPDLGESARSGAQHESVAARQLSEVQSLVGAVIAKFPNSGMSVTRDARGVVISLSAAKFFQSGEAEISPEQLGALVALIGTLQGLPNRLEIDGFTDSVPVANQRFHDNWELSAARSASVLRYMVAHSSIEPARLTIAGYGPYMPIGDNNTEEGRALNRRVEIVIREVGER